MIIFIKKVMLSKPICEEYDSLIYNHFGQ